MRVRREAALAALALIASVAPAAAQPEPLVIASMVVDITIGADASLRVRESIDFEYNHLVTLPFRMIPLRTPDGRLVRVRDVREVGGPVPLGITEHEHAVEVHPRGGLTLSHEGDLPLRLAYTVYRAVRAGPDGDVLDWLVMPNEWKGSVRRLRVEIHLPSTVPPASPVRATLTRENGALVHGHVTRGMRVIRLDTPVAANAGESARLTVVWPTGHVDLAAPEPPAPWPWSWMLRLTPAWWVPAALLVLTGLVRAANHYAGRRALVPSYAPPAGLRPGEAGVVIDGRIDAEDIVAAVVDLAVRGYLSLERAPGETDVVVTVRRPWVGDPDVRPWEAVLLANVFTSPGYATTALSVLRGPRDSASIREALSADLAERGFFSSAPLALRRVGRWVAVIGAAVWLQLAMNAGASVSTLLAGIATGAVVWLLGGVAAAGGLTAEALRARQALRGFRAFLARVDAPRLERLPAGTLDENLPWAIALGVTEAWLTPTPVR